MQLVASVLQKKGTPLLCVQWKLVKLRFDDNSLKKCVRTQMGRNIKLEKLLTIAIPCYNSAAYVKRALDSIDLTDKRVEVIMVDDGSTDDTAAIGYEYVER